MTATSIPDAVTRLLATALAERHEWHPSQWPAHMTLAELREREAVLRARGPKLPDEPLDATTMVFLRLAVPLWVERYRDLPASICNARAHAIAPTLASHQGVAAIIDPDARGTVKKGSMGGAFNLLAEGLALMSLCPGGVDFGGEHWEAK